MQRKVFFISLAVALSACVGTILPRVSPTQAEWAARQWPDASLTQLEQGRALYVNRCSGCHNLPVPTDYTLEEWPKWLDEMAPRAKVEAGEKELIWRYLAAVSQNEKPLKER